MAVDDTERALFAAWDQIRARELELGRDGLAHADRVFVAIWDLEAQVNDGGFHQWLFNSTGDRAVETVAALREVGASDAAALCERVFALLPAGRPSPDHGARQQQLEDAGDDFEDACSELDDELSDLEDDLRDRLYSYLRAHPAN
jgi:hypothetical protein